MTSVSTLMASLEAREGISKLPDNFQDSSDDIQVYLNKTEESFQQILTTDVEQVKKNMIKNILKGENITVKIEKLENLYNETLTHIKELVSLCQVNKECKSQLGDNSELDKFQSEGVNNIIDTIINIEERLLHEIKEGDIETKLKPLSLEARNIFGSAQNLLKKAKRQISSASPAFQNYVHYW